MQGPPEFEQLGFAAVCICIHGMHIATILINMCMYVGRYDMHAWIHGWLGGGRVDGWTEVCVCVFVWLLSLCVFVWLLSLA